MSIRDNILSSVDIVVEKLDVPFWGTIWVRTLTAGEQERWHHFEGEHKAGYLAALVIADEFGNRVFTDEDAAAIQDKSGANLDLVINKYLDLNKIDVASVNEAKKN